MYTLKDGNLDGLSKSWYESGQLKSNGDFTDPIWPDDGLGARIGTWYYWHENGCLGGVYNYIEGYPKGVSINWDSLGNVVNLEITLNDGYWNELSYYDNLQLASRLEYKSNEKMGFHRYWFKNGQLKEEAYYKNDSLEGETKEWDKYGNLLRIDKYNKGKLIFKKTF